MAHKHSVTIKGEVEFFVKKADKSFGVEIRNSAGNLVTKLYGSINRKAYMQDFTIGDLIDKKGKVVFKKASRKATAKAEVVEKKAGKGIRKDIDQLSKNIANAFAQFVS